MAEKPARRFRRLRRLALAGLVLLLLAAAALWAFLPAIVERVATERLAAMGVPAPSLSVQTIGLDHAVIAELGAGSAGEFAAREIVIAYRLSELIDGKVDGVTFRGVALHASLDFDGLSLGSLDPLLAGGGGGALALPPVQVEDATLSLATALGTIEVAVDGSITSNQSGIAAALRYGARAPQGTATGTLDLRQSGREIEAQVVLAEAQASLPELGRASGGGRLLLRASEGAVRRLDGHFDIAALESADPRLAPLGTLNGTVDIAGGPGGWQLRSHAGDAERSFAADLRLSAPELRLIAPVTLALDLAAGDSAPLWRMARLPQPRGGSVSLSAVLHATPTEFLVAATGGGNSPTLDGSIAIDADRLALPGLAEALSAAGGLDLRYEGGALLIQAPAPLLADVTLAPEQAAALPPMLAPILGHKLSVSLELPEPLRIEPHEDGNAVAGRAALAVALTDGTPLLDLAATGRAFMSGSGAVSYDLTALDAALNVPERTALPPGRATMTGQASGRAGADGREAEADMMLTVAAGQVTAVGFAARGLSARLPLALTYADGHLSVRLAAPGEVAAAHVSGPTPFTLDGPLRLPLGPSKEPVLTADLGDGGAPRMKLDLTAGPVALAGSLGTEGGPIAGKATLPRLHLSGSGTADALTVRLRATGASLSVPSYEAEATGLDLDIELSAGQAPRIALTGAVAHRGTPAYVIPLSAAIRAHEIRNGWAFNGDIKDAFGRISLTLEGRHDLASGTGGATLKLAPIELIPSVRQPEDLAPWLKGLAQEVSGTVALAGDVTWTRDVVAAKLELLLRDLSATTDAATVERLNGVIAIDGLLPPSTPAGQQVAVALIDAGLPLTDGLLTFRVAPGPRLEVAGGSLHLAGGTVEVEPLVYDPASDRNEAVLVVHGVDLGELLALAGVDGLAGQGRLSGRIPIVVTPTDVIISGGALEAEAPGSLSYAPLTPPAALQGQGESVSLALSALTNFQYQALRLTVDRQAGGEMNVAMHVRGSNPDFYDGYPVEFNLNVTGALDRVLRQGLAGYRIPAAIEQRLQEFGQ